MLDASTAHRTHSDWVYGLPELNAAARTAIASADKVSNPGCYPQGFILSVLPLIEAGLLDAATPLRCYGLGLFRWWQTNDRVVPGPHKTQADALNTQAYGLTQSHKHLPEMQHYSGCDQAPIFLPTVAHYYKGMLVSVALFADELSGATPEDVQRVLAQRYAGERFISASC